MPTQDPRPVSLTDVPAGTSARLHATTLDTETRALLRALGLTDGSPLHVCKRGDPFIIQVRTTRIGVANAVARDIYVTPQRS